MFAVVAAALCLFAALPAVLATPTTPVFVNTLDLAQWYVLQSTAQPGTGLTVTNSSAFNASLHTVVATAQFNASANDMGWDYFRVTPNQSAAATSASRLRFAAGYAEGFITWERIATAWIPGMSTKAAAWVQTHLAYMQDAVAARTEDKLWAEIGLLFDQMKGMADGFNSAASASTPTLTFEDVFMINFAAEIGDVETAVSNGDHAPQSGKVATKKKKPFDSHCSGFIKFTNDDLYVAHDTWSGYSSMTYRMYKVYDFCPTVVFSSHPGFISSMDDWYQTSTQLAIMETTNDIMNLSLYEYVVPETVSEFLRVMAATFLATDAESWTTYFARHNSGTYNNQYMVVDFKNFAPGASLPDEGILWIAEQIPGFVYRKDMTKHLKEHGYWASYNIPYSPYIFDVSGYAEALAQQGTFWSYTQYARAEIFQRNQQTVATVEDVQRLMRLNNYTTDHFALIPNCTGAAHGGTCSPAYSSMLAVASRGDLMPVYNTTAEMIAHYGPLYGYMAQGCFGAIDAKIARYADRHTLSSRVISGPTSDGGLPPFAWGTNGCGAAPAGPTVVDFPWVEFFIDGAS